VSGPRENLGRRWLGTWLDSRELRNVSKSSQRTSLLGTRKVTSGPYQDGAFDTFIANNLIGVWNCMWWLLGAPEMHSGDICKLFWYEHYEAPN